jgi:hypothetical protein
MTARAFLLALTFILALALALPPGAAADAVGRITQVEGQVDLLKGGKLPATPAKMDDPLQPGDVIRTKSLSRVQLTFVDNTVLTIAPESRLAIEEYLFDPAKTKRSAVLQLFRGLAHIVVTKLYKVQEPDFIFKTHTAALGVRGTEIGIRLAPNSSTILNFDGLIQVANVFPEVGEALFNRVSKIAFAFGRASVMLHKMQGTVVARGLPPTMPFEVSPQDQKQFMQQLVTGLVARKRGKDAGNPGTAQAGSGFGRGGSGNSAGSSGADGSSAADPGKTSAGGSGNPAGDGSAAMSASEATAPVAANLTFSNVLSTGADDSIGKGVLSKAAADVPVAPTGTGLGGDQAVSTMETGGLITFTPSSLGTAISQPGTVSPPPVLTTTLNSANIIPKGASLAQTGGLTTTLKP